MNEDMKKNTITNTLPLPDQKDKTPLQVRVDTKLLEAADSVRSKMHITKQDMAEYGLRAFIAAADPKLAKKMGILKEE